MIDVTAEQVDKTPVEQEFREADAPREESNKDKIDGLLEAGASRMAHEQPKAEQQPEGGPQEEEKQAVEVSEEEPGGEPEKVELPTHWPEEMRSEIAQLPVEARKRFLSRHKEMERGYNDKFQSLAKEREKLSAHQQLINHIQTNPDFARYVFSYGNSQAQPQAADQRPEDPVEAIAWDAAQQAREAILKDLAPTLEQQQALRAQVDRQAAEAHFRSDPLFREVDIAVEGYVNSQPTQEMREHMKRTLLSDMSAYGNVYMALRQGVAEKYAQQPEQSPAQPQQKQRTVKPREAPKLEDAGGPVNEDGVKRNSRLAQLTKRFKTNRGSIDDLGEYFDLKGVNF